MVMKTAMDIPDRLVEAHSSKNNSHICAQALKLIVPGDGS